MGAALKHPKDSQAGILRDTSNAFTKINPDNHGNPIETTPKNIGVSMPNKRLFHDTLLEETDDIDVVPMGIDLEVLLINSCRIDATKVQTIVESFVRHKEHTT